jgi:plasmid replication initiation protein
MDYDKRLQIAEERSYMVAKGNEIIQRARVDLGLMEQKSFCYAVSKIKPTDTLDTEYEFAINDYCDVCGINRNDGRTIENVKAALKKLRDKSFYLLDENGAWVLIGWLAKVKILPRSGKVKFKFDEDMQKYLIGLRERGNFTQYSLMCVLPMKSAYSVRLYELLKSYLGQGAARKKFNTDDLKKRLAAPYVNFKDFRTRALEVAVREVNQYTDIETTWEPITKGRKVVEVEFVTKEKGAIKRFEADREARDTLDGQMEMLPDGTLTTYRKTNRKKKEV